MRKILVEAIRLAILSGQQVMNFYHKRYSYELKEDLSPITQADLCSNEILILGLSKIVDFPICTEESPISLKDRTQKSFYWLIDPLDGTKDFIAKTNHFTINIALMESKCHTPIFGIIYAPAINRLYCGGEDFGFFQISPSKIEDFLNQSKWEKLEKPKKVDVKTNKIFACDSKFHGTQEGEMFLHYFNLRKRIIGSSLKFCALALGFVDIYPRFNGSKEWDIAAGDAILRGSGGKIWDFQTGERLRYGTDDFKNPFFLALSSKASLYDLDFLSFNIKAM